jgi:hypothetical protein
MNSKPVIALAGAIAISAIGLAGGQNGSPSGSQAPAGQPAAAQPPAGSTNPGAPAPASRKPVRPAGVGWGGPGPVRLVLPWPPSGGRS